MAAGDLLTADYQYEYNNVLLGVDTPFDMRELSGFLGYPSLRTSTVDSFGAHGGVRGNHYVPIRTFTAKLWIIGPSSNEEMANLKRTVAIAFAPRVRPEDELSLIYQHPGTTPKHIKCRPTALDLPVNRRYSLDVPEIDVRFEAADPRHYNLEVKSATATLPSQGGGLDFPLDFPLNFAPGSTNSILLINEGDAPTHWIAEITGPCTNPRIEATSNVTGETLYLAFQNLTVVEGEVLVLDSSNRSIMLNGQPKRANLIPGSQWWAMPAFPDYLTVHYTSSNNPVTSSTATFTWSDASWGV